MKDQVRIGIAGCGGIGSNVAMHLARAGLERFKIVDFDRIEASNLNRQFYFQDQVGGIKTETLETNLRRINPGLILDRENKKLNSENIAEVFRDCAVVVEGFDKAEDKAMFLEALAESGRFFVSACGVAGLDTSEVKTRPFGKNGFIVGDFKTDNRDAKLYSCKVGFAAARMAELVLKHLGFKDR